MKEELKAKQQAAREFAMQHAIELAREQNEWDDLAVLPDGKMRELALLCDFAGHSSLAVAQNFAGRALREVALSSPPAQAEQSGWMPIADCPMTGQVLVLSEDMDQSVRNCASIRALIRDAVFNGERCYFTHFMLLPTPPKGQA